MGCGRVRRSSSGPHPCFDDLYGAALTTIDQWHSDVPIRVLDLGAGTGLFSSMIRARFPCAQLCLVDGSEAMLAEARRRFDGIDTVSYRPGYMGSMDLGGSWDLIVSALAIHHLEHEAKRDVFGRILQALVPGGLFVNAEQVLGPTPALEAAYARRWLDDVRAAGIPEAEIGKAAERMAFDRCATVEHQLEWLRQAGFLDVDCTFKLWRFAVLRGRRTSGELAWAD